MVLNNTHDNLCTNGALLVAFYQGMIIITTLLPGSFTILSLILGAIGE